MPTLRSVMLSLAAAIILAGQGPAQGTEHRIVSAANVRVRTQPTPDAPIVTHLVLGTSLRAQRLADTSWLRVTMNDGTRGYLRGNLTAVVRPGERLRVEEAIAEARLARAREDFAARLELFDMTNRMRAEPGESETRGRLTLLWLRSLDALLGSVPFRHRREPYQSWLDAHGDLVVYSEPGGRWLVRYETLRSLHDAHRGTPAGDEIAWFTRENGLRGECEGYVPCYLDWLNKLDAEYLRGYPRGRHASEAVERIGTAVSAVLKSASGHFAGEFLPRADCPTAVATGDSLRGAVLATVVPERERTLAVLDTIGLRCRDGRVHPAASRGDG